MPLIKVFEPIDKLDDAIIELIDNEDAIIFGVNNLLIDVVAKVVKPDTDKLETSKILILALLIEIDETIISEIDKLDAFILLI